MNLQLPIDSIPALIHTGLRNGDLDDFNQARLNYVGLTLEDLSGWKWTAAFQPEDLAARVEKWRRKFLFPTAPQSRVAARVIVDIPRMPANHRLISNGGAHSVGALDKLL
jgi:hypothetical protein